MMITLMSVTQASSYHLPLSKARVCWDWLLDIHTAVVCFEKFVRGRIRRAMTHCGIIRFVMFMILMNLKLTHPFWETSFVPPCFMSVLEQLVWIQRKSPSACKHLTTLMGFQVIQSNPQYILN